MDEVTREYPFRTLLSFRPFIDYLKSGGLDTKTTDLHLNKGIQEILRQAPELYNPIEDFGLLKRHKDKLSRLMHLVFPPVYWDTEFFAAVIPFSLEPVVASPSFRRLFLHEDGRFKSTPTLKDEDFNRGRVIRAYLFILERFYGIKKSLDYPIIHIVIDPDTGLNRYFKLNLDFRFAEARAVGKPKSLTDEERAFVLDNMTHPEVLREILPPSDFELHGFTVIQAVDVTESEVMSALERDLIDQESIISQAGFLRVQERLRTFFGRSQMVATLSAIQGDLVFLINSGCDLTRNCIFADSRHLPISKFEGTPYERAIQNAEVLHIPDVLEEPSFKHKKEEIHEHGVRSLLIAPLHYQGECIGTLDLGSPEPGDLGPMDGLLMHPIQPLFSVAIKRALEDSNNRVQGVIKEKCTAIHPTVEWRFRHAAIHYLENLQKEGDAEIEAIVFKDVFPLYGISDVRGSSDERNRAIKEDLMEQLKLGLKILELAHEERPIPILRELGTRVEGHIQRLLSGLGSGDEVSVGKFLKEDVESIFDHLAGFGLKVSRAVEAYQSAIDPNVGTIYKQRRHFEDSVSKLTHRLASVLDEKEAGAQAIFPHYYERHRTDGVDYLIYMGDSLLENGGFHELYLKDLRLWQLKLACALAVETERLKTSLTIPLETAHLILVQNTPLSIRFRFDEKRFDVDGAYDIRHEIIKSRLDKAMVKGRRERLTQPGKIAIVYSHPDEGIEMRRHIDYLRSEGLLTDELERLELEDLPGVQGLKSFRVGVNLDVQAHSQSMEGVAS